MTRVFAWVVVLGCIFCAPLHAEEIGVLVLAHGGSAQWNQTVQETVAQAQLAYPTEIAFGMGMHADEVQGIQQAIDALERQGVSRLVVVPLLISSVSEVMRQFEYLLGARDHGPWEEHAHPVALHVPIMITQPLDDDPVVAEILSERAQALSRVPAQESVVLVAHGPTTDEDNAQWLAVMTRLAAHVQADAGFRSVIPITMRDDAPKPVQEEATRQLRALVRREGEQGRVLVVPLLLANGGIEAKIPKRLEGLAYEYQGQALLPHPKLAQWLTHHVETAAGHPSTLVAQAKQL